MQVKDITQVIEAFAPPVYQEGYDNSGLLIGNPNQEINAALLTLDITEDVIQEAIDKKCNLIVAHHPIIFSGIKRLTGSNYVERCIIKAIQNKIAIYACHTNMDNVIAGVNKKIADKLGLINTKILQPKKGLLQKLVVFVPIENAEHLRTKLFEAGAGNIGNYSECSFNITGIGTFKGNEESNPTIGTKNNTEKVEELRIELIFEAHKQSAIITSLKENHPYEEVAYYISDLENEYQNTGSGMIGEFDDGIEIDAFLTHLKGIFKVPLLKHTKKITKTVKKVAFCGGAGNFLLKDAIKQKADVFLSADFTYHKYFDAENKIVICDIGHYETEQFTPEIFYEVITKKFPTFALHLSNVNTNPINYF